MEVIRQLAQHLPPVALDLFRLCIWLLLLMLIFIPLERLFGQRRQKIFRTAVLTDLGYYFLSGMLATRLLLAPLAILAWGLHYLVPVQLQQWTASLPLGIRFLAAMVVGEFGTYWGHRWQHEIPWLWRFHAIHHSAEQIDWLVNTRAHPVDLVFTRLCGFIPMYALGLVQAGGKPDAMTVLVIFVGTLWGFFIHANLRWRFGWLEWLISTPHFHHWHHTNDGNALINKNYAAMLPWVDMLFGTFYLPGKQWPFKYGINGPMADSLFRQLVQPFGYRA
ncbi:MAG: sterol desaturase family protein [Methylococcales bacterium]|nr:sterol desaturase family protein [Methylococcales bacterium]